MKYIKKGKEIYNNNQKEPNKMKQGYDVFLKGLGDLIECYKTE